MGVESLVQTGNALAALHRDAFEPTRHQTQHLEPIDTLEMCHLSLENKEKLTKTFKTSNFFWIILKEIFSILQDLEAVADELLRQGLAAPGLSTRSFIHDDEKLVSLGSWFTLSSMIKPCSFFQCLGPTWDNTKR